MPLKIWKIGASLDDEHRGRAVATDTGQVVGVGSELDAYSVRLTRKPTAEVLYEAKLDLDPGW